MAETDGREELQGVGCCKSGEAFYQANDPSHAFGIADLFYQGGNVIVFPVIDQDAPAGFIQEGTDGFAFGEQQEGVTQKILGEVDDGGMNCVVFVPLEKGVVIAPVVGQIGTEEDNVPGLEAFDMIANELGTAAMVEIDQFDFGVIMPAIVYKRLPVFPDTE